MAIRKTKKATRKGRTYTGIKKAKTKMQRGTSNYCIQPVAPEREFEPQVNNDRAALIRVSGKKWTNGTRLHYYFFTNASQRGTAAERNIVRNAFKKWKNVGIGLHFDEVDSIDEAEIRIGFRRGDGAWSYVGRDVLDQGQSDRTMNFGWNIANDIDTAIHEIGHTLGFPHEHQNPNAGIVWDEEKVYSALALPPNNWSRATTHWNIIRKLSQSEVGGSGWDKDSIMHYPFDKGMILEPAEYITKRLDPKPGLSAKDKEWAKKFYPSLSIHDYQLMKPYRFVRKTLNPGQQINFYVKPTENRSYKFQTFGRSDTVMVLFEEVNGRARYLTADDDSGRDYNAKFTSRLFSDRTYILRVRLYWQHRRGDFGVLMW